MSQKAQLPVMGRRIGALQAGAAEHDVDAVEANVVPDALPQELKHRACAVRGKNAGAAKLEKAQIGMAGQKRRHIKLTLTVKSATRRGRLLAKHAVGSDHALRAGPIQHQHMIAECVEFIAVTARRARRCIGPGAQLAIKDTVAQLLCGKHVFGGMRQHHAEVASRRQHVSGSVTLKLLEFARAHDLGALPGPPPPQLPIDQRNAEVRKRGFRRRSDGQPWQSPRQDPPGRMVSPKSRSCRTPYSSRSPRRGHWR